jgi:hypothetical protein
VGLAAVMNLVLKEVGEKARHGFIIDPAAALNANRSIEHLVVEGDREIDQAAIDCALRGPKRLARRKGLLRIEEAQSFGVDGPTLETALERVDVILVDRDVVVERGPERREKAGACGRELGRRQQVDGAEQAMIGPRVVVGHRGKMVNEAAHGGNTSPRRGVRCISQTSAREHTACYE